MNPALTTVLLIQARQMLKETEERDRQTRIRRANDFLALGKGCVLPGPTLMMLVVESARNERERLRGAQAFLEKQLRKEARERRRKKMMEILRRPGNVLIKFYKMFKDKKDGTREIAQSDSTEKRALLGESGSQRSYDTTEETTEKQAGTPSTTKEDRTDRPKWQPTARQCLEDPFWTPSQIPAEKEALYGPSNAKFWMFYKLLRRNYPERTALLYKDFLKVLSKPMAHPGDSWFVGTMQVVLCETHIIHIECCSRCSHCIPALCSHCTPALSQ